MRKKKTLAQKIVAEAETYIGTPFLHQGRLKGRGIDCANFIGNVARESGINVEIPNNYHPREDGTVMMKLLSKHMTFVPTEDRQAGDVLALCDEALREPDIPRHLAFVKEVTPTTTFIIHASERGVKAHRINGHWLKRIHSCWRLK